MDKDNPKKTSKLAPSEQALRETLASKGYSEEQIEDLMPIISATRIAEETPEEKALRAEKADVARRGMRRLDHEGRKIRQEENPDFFAYEERRVDKGTRKKWEGEAERAGKSVADYLSLSEFDRFKAINAANEPARKAAEEARKQGNLERGRAVVDGLVAERERRENPGSLKVLENPDGTNRLVVPGGADSTPDKRVGFTKQYDSPEAMLAARNATAAKGIDPLGRPQTPEEIAKAAEEDDRARAQTTQNYIQSGLEESERAWLNLSTGERARRDQANASRTDLSQTIERGQWNAGTHPWEDKFSEVRVALGTARGIVDRVGSDFGNSPSLEIAEGNFKSFAAEKAPFFPGSSAARVERQWNDHQDQLTKMNSDRAFRSWSGFSDDQRAAGRLKGGSRRG
jgi:hypothetical protein